MDSVIYPETKRCRSCLSDLPITDFYKNYLTRDNHLNICKKCHDEKMKANHRVRYARRKAEAERLLSGNQ